MGFASADSPSCVKAVTITFKNTSIKLKQNRQITINADEITKFPTLFDGARVRIASSIFMVIHLPNALEVWWDGVSRVYINAPAEFYGKFFDFTFIIIIRRSERGIGDSALVYRARGSGFDSVGTKIFMLVSSLEKSRQSPRVSCPQKHLSKKSIWNQH